MNRYRRKRDSGLLTAAMFSSAWLQVEFRTKQSEGVLRLKPSSSQPRVPPRSFHVWSRSLTPQAICGNI